MSPALASEAHDCAGGQSDRIAKDLSDLGEHIIDRECVFIKNILAEELGLLLVNSRRGKRKMIAAVG